MRSIRLPFSNYDHDFDEYILTNSPGERWPRNSRAADSGLVNMLLMQPALMEAIDQKLDNESGPFYGFEFLQTWQDRYTDQAMVLVELNHSSSEASSTTSGGSFNGSHARSSTSGSSRSSDSGSSWDSGRVVPGGGSSATSFTSGGWSTRGNAGSGSGSDTNSMSSRSTPKSSKKDEASHGRRKRVCRGLGHESSKNGRHHCDSRSRFRYRGHGDNRT